KEFFHLFLENLNEEISLTNSEVNFEKLQQRACKLAIKAGHKLNELEIKKLVTDIVNGKISLTCPHGRPFISKITKIDLEKMFSRR
ncbi:MAG: DNA mismatch repair protein MutL, partial [Candidatus Margulisiibacteriota bacterium]